MCPLSRLYLKAVICVLFFCGAEFNIKWNRGDYFLNSAGDFAVFYYAPLETNQGYFSGRLLLEA